MSKKNKKKEFRDNLIARNEEASTVRKIVSIIIISLILIFLVGIISGYMYIKSALQPVDPGNEQGVEVEIPLGSTSSSIANILEEKGIIKDSRIFRIYTKVKNESDFQAGAYTFTPAMTIDEIIESLKSGVLVKEPIDKVTIPEGKTVEEIAEIFAEKKYFSKKDFIDKVNDEKYVEELIEAYPSILSEEILDEDIRTPLEGYLFAATYDIYVENPNINDIIETMLDRTAEVVNENQKDIDKKKFTVHEALTFASLVEKEASSKDQRKGIASVFYNRLEEGMPLQTDPTVLYAMGEHKDKVLLKDLEIESPYNTYQIDTLPVGPISNFSVNSLKASLHPEKSDYKYFLHDNEGGIHFAETHEEHIKLKQKYID
ncbi:endolytic transglycosylase MltG [Virgibacillus sp. MSJ-26]|uniref:endolytic transglycosylase MltG n=1 Tax=Virgibacillus sp. MSJ-26 TaxID=2841522 RepID=UPI001C104555|nr:endolytic transglycosylase MltG [Virgibacillus sp. MSJ-26]MBU5466480.1 endolytic transglycosylase MltG [Virgibacillus sp. MSJ-26]